MTKTGTQVVTLHPAKFSRSILVELGRQLELESKRENRPLSIFDPFAGVGRVHELASTTGVTSVGIEIEPGWAANHPDTICGDARDMDTLLAGRIFDAMVTSPCYGNRMADHHKASDICTKLVDGIETKCGGSGLLIAETGAAWSAADGLEVVTVPCKACGGFGLSKRNTYTHTMQRALKDPSHQLSAGTASVMAWGPKYRQFHELIWRRALHRIRPGGLAIVNVSNFLETIKGRDVEHHVAEWHLNCWLLLGCTLVEAVRVATSRNGEGANGEKRIDGELVLVLRTPDNGRQMQLIP